MKQKFTLIEMMVILAIIAILMSILIPGLGRSRDAARTAVCMSRQKQVFYGAQMYMNGNKHRLFSPNNTQNVSIGSEFWGNYVDVVFEQMYGEDLGKREEGHKVFTCSLDPDGEPQNSTDTRWRAFATRTIRKEYMPDVYVNYLLFPDPSNTWIFGDGYRIDEQQSIFRMNEEGDSNNNYAYPHMRHGKGKLTMMTYVDGHGESVKWPRLKELDFTGYVPYGTGAVINEL